MSVAFGIVAFFILAWLITGEIRNAHHCSCDQPDCGGGCESRR